MDGGSVDTSMPPGTWKRMHRCSLEVFVAGEDRVRYIISTSPRHCQPRSDTRGAASSDGDTSDAFISN